MFPRTQCLFCSGEGVLCGYSAPCSSHSVSLESCCNTNAQDLNQCIRHCLPPQQSLASAPGSGGNACFIVFKSQKEHLVCLLLAKCPVVFLCLQTALSKNGPFLLVHAKDTGPKIKTYWFLGIHFTCCKQIETDPNMQQCISSIAEQLLISKVEKCTESCNDTSCPSSVSREPA